MVNVLLFPNGLSQDPKPILFLNPAVPRSVEDPHCEDGCIGSMHSHVCSAFVISGRKSHLCTKQQNKRKIPWLLVSIRAQRKTAVRTAPDQTQTQTETKRNVIQTCHLEDNRRLHGSQVLQLWSTSLDSGPAPPNKHSTAAVQIEGPDSRKQ